MDGHVAVAPAHRHMVRDDHPGIDNHGIVLVDDQRVDVELDDPRQLADHFRHPQQHRFQRLHVGRRHPAERSQQFCDAGAADQLRDQEAVQRRQGHRPVPVHLDRDAAAAEGDRRAEYRVADDADHQFTAVRTPDHGLDDHAADACLRFHARRLPDHLGETRAHRRGIAQVQQHAADVGLVGDVRGIDFEHDGIT